MTFNIAIGTMLALAGALGLGYFLDELRLAFVSAKWPRTPGKIERSRIDEGYDEGPTYSASLQFRYSVDGHEFKGHRTRFGGEWRHSWRGLAETDVRRYPNGSDVMVAYDPSNPARSVLEPGAVRRACGGLLISGGFVALGLGMAVWGG